jgi:hypothetical protein
MERPSVRDAVDQAIDGMNDYLNEVDALQHMILADTVSGGGIYDAKAYRMAFRMVISCYRVAQSTVLPTVETPHRGKWRI